MTSIITFTYYSNWNPANGTSLVIHPNLCFPWSTTSIENMNHYLVHIGKRGQKIFFPLVEEGLFVSSYVIFCVVFDWIISNSLKFLPGFLRDSLSCSHHWTVRTHNPIQGFFSISVPIEGGHQSSTFRPTVSVLWVLYSNQSKKTLSNFNYYVFLHLCNIYKWGYVIDSGIGLSTTIDKVRLLITVSVHATLFIVSLHV